MNIFKYIRKQRSLYYEYENAMSKLKTITGVDDNGNEPVTGLTGLTELIIEGELKQVEEIKPGEYKIKE